MSVAAVALPSLPTDPTTFSITEQIIAEPEALIPTLQREDSSDSDLSLQKPKKKSWNKDTQGSNFNPRMGSHFTLSYKDAAHQWWTSISGLQAERMVLNLIPYLKEAPASIASSTPSTPSSALASLKTTDPFGQRIWHSQMVPLSGRNRLINEYSVERLSEPQEETLVMLHGYGAGLGFFYQNFEPLSRVAGWKLYALDMLGMGNSSRPNFRITSKDKQGKIREAENFFIDALEEWRQIRKIDKMTLLGHSLGGYLAVSYALKYPGHINKLILASPVGVPENPFAVQADLPPPAESSEVGQTTQQMATQARVAADMAGSDTKSLNENAPEKPRWKAPGWVHWLWDTNMVSPFSLVRFGGPLGPRFVSGWSSRRFGHLPEDEARLMHNYVYNLFRQRGSGEFALTYLLVPGAYARDPIINRIQNVGRGLITSPPSTEPNSVQSETPRTKETGFPIVFFYGDDDWMDVKGGRASVKKLAARAKEALAEASVEEKRTENGSGKVIVVSNSGHNMFLDNPEEFNEAMIKELEETRDYGRKMKAGRR